MNYVHTVGWSGVDDFPDAYAAHEVVSDGHGRARDYIFLEVNQAFEQMTGLRRSEIVGRKVSQVLPGIRLGSFDWIAVYGRLAQTGGCIHFEQYSEPLGRWYDVCAFSRGNGRFVTIFRDISRYKPSTSGMQEEGDPAIRVLDSMQEACFELDVHGRITLANTAGGNLVDADANQLRGKNFLDLCADPENVTPRLEHVLRTGASEYAVDVQLLCLDGSSVYAEFSITPVTDEQGGIRGSRWIGKDITQRKEYEAQLEYMSLRDRLTGLYNRAYFENEMERLGKSRDYPITILSVDLDGLKLVNDTMGHKQGDTLLMTCARILKSSFRSSDVLARIGGDEFAAILPRTEGRAGEGIARRIVEQVRAHNAKGDSPLPVSLSIGRSTVQGRSESLARAYKEADDLMYRDKLHKGGDARSEIINSLLKVMEEKQYIDRSDVEYLQNLCLATGREAGLNRKQLSSLALLAQVHDLGKVGVADSILRKEEPLTEEEWEVLRTHPEKGYRIARSSTDLAEIAELILKHHERWNGQGYPLGIAGREIPVECRVLAIANAYMAMINERPHQRAMSRAEALQELWRCAGTQFDPALVQAFARIISREAENEELGEAQ
ncbi:diguanylate cyclase domain-containing protein [Desulfovermiculus halophilus]|uniref:diguanylate cyclase domain-containing protein n=1 Tax=Desulfovermiculus halophilus TaxID=339722 RepID=UPI0006861CD2|nr:diguanylate cyclase [Desulfovermiculus halophilus]